MSALPRPGAVGEVAVESLGFLGDGLGLFDGVRVAVPTALPGERWRVRFERKAQGLWRAEPLDCLEASPIRQVPVCPHFGACGGCRLQHLTLDTYVDLKRRRIAGALRAQGVDAPPFLPTAASPQGARRRLRMVVGADGRLGFRRLRSRTPVPVEVCPIALPRLTRLFEPLSAALRDLDAMAAGDEVELALIGEALDLVLHPRRRPNGADRERIALLTERLDLARVALGGDPPETVVERAPVVLQVGEAVVEPPPGAFLQATEAGEAALRAFAIDHALEGPVLDLFAGCGSFALGLGRAGRPVVAVERDAAMVAAVKRAARRWGANVEAVARDLHRRPMQPNESNPFATVILDPPRSGAAEQCAALASSKAARVVYASCEPASFARDAALLIEGGYRLKALLPVDQFLYAAEIELIAAFERTRPGRAKGA